MQLRFDPFQKMENVDNSTRLDGLQENEEEEENNNVIAVVSGIEKNHR